MAARPDSMTSYRNLKQDVIPSEAQVQGQSGSIGDNLEEEQVRMAVEQSKRDMFHDPTETPDTGGSAASASPSLQSTPQDQSQPGNQPSISKEELTRTQALFKQVCDEVEALQRKMHGASFTTQDMDRLEYLQPIVVKYRKKMGLLEARAQAAEETSQQSQGVTARTTKVLEKRVQSTEQLVRRITEQQVRVNPSHRFMTLVICFAKE